MRLIADLLGLDAALPLLDDEGMTRVTLWRHAARWACRDAPLDFRLLGAEAIAVPEPEPTEPVVGALARLLRSTRGTGTLIMLVNPFAAVGVENIPVTEGVRLFGVTSDADMRCWDAILSTGQPVYGVCGQTTLDVQSARATSALSALAYGLFTSDTGLSLTGLHEDRAGVVYACDRATTAEVIIKGGFEGGELRGEANAQITWKDRGNEGYVRLAIQDADGNRCLTQPRFVVQARTHG